MSNANDFIIENGVLKKYAPETADTKVTIPEEVHTIGANAFKGCEQLTEIEIPESVRVIESLAFDGCTSLQELILPEGITQIGFGAFFNCRQLKTLRLPAGIQTARAGGFWASSDEVVTDPRLQLFRYAFYGCISLKEIIALGVTELDTSFVPMETWGVTTLEVPSYVMPEVDLSKVKNARIKQALALGYLSNIDKYPSHDTYRKLVCAQKNALLPVFFKTDNVVAITILAEEKKITQKNYEEEYLNPANEIGATQIKAFLLSWKNESPKKKSAKAELELELKEKPLSLAALKKIWGWEDAEEGFVNICHYKGKDTDLVIPSILKDLHVAGVGKSCFSSADRRVTPERDAFFEKELQSVTISDGITTIGDYAFCSCKNLQSVSMPKTLKEVGVKAFHYCENLTHISGTENITCIKRCAFEMCYRLEGEIYLISADSIEDFAFNRCNSKLDIHFSDSLSYIGNFAFSGCSNTTIHAPAGSYAEVYAKEHSIPFVAE